MANPNDNVRDAILRHLHDVHQKARGPSSMLVGVRDLCSALKPLGYKQTEVNSNLDYLVQKKWVTPITIKRPFTTPKGNTSEAATTKYKISDIGIDKLEGGSVYQVKDSFNNINVTTISGVTVIGNGNVVNTNYTDLSRHLTEFQQAVQNSSQLSEANKLALIADISTIQSQLSKVEPNISVIKTVWTGVEKLATAAGFVDFVGKVAPFILLLGNLA